MPLSAEARKALAAVDWMQADRTPAMVSRQMKAASTNLFN